MITKAAAFAVVVLSAVNAWIEIAQVRDVPEETRR